MLGIFEYIDTYDAADIQSDKVCQLHYKGQYIQIY